MWTEIAYTWFIDSNTCSKTCCSVVPLENHKFSLKYSQETYLALIFKLCVFVSSNSYLLPRAHHIHKFLLARLTKFDIFHNRLSGLYKTWKKIMPKPICLTGSFACHGPLGPWLPEQCHCYVFCSTGSLLWWIMYRVDSRFASSQWKMVLLCNDVSHCLGTNLESAQM